MVRVLLEKKLFAFAHYVRIFVSRVCTAGKRKRKRHWAGGFKTLAIQNEGSTITLHTAGVVQHAGREELEVLPNYCFPSHPSNYWFSSLVCAFSATDSSDTSPYLLTGQPSLRYHWLFFKFLLPLKDVPSGGHHLCPMLTMS